MSLNSTSNSLSSSATFTSNSSINSTPPADRYAALKDLDDQLRESKTSINGSAFNSPGKVLSLFSLKLFKIHHICNNSHVLAVIIPSLKFPINFIPTEINNSKSFFVQILTLFKIQFNELFA